jgi:hypothetical protein
MFLPTDFAFICVLFNVCSPSFKAVNGLLLETGAIRYEKLFGSLPAS